MALTLSTYLTQTRRLLHDALGVFWIDSELTDYINDARNAVAGDTGCYRTLQTFTLSPGVELYQFTSLPSGSATIAVLGITVLWGGERIAYDYQPFSQFNAQNRFFTSYNSRPGVFTCYGQNTVYMRPIPDQAYVTEWDTITTPPAMVKASDAEVLLYPYTEAVPFYAAWKAKYKEQSYSESDLFMAEYRKTLLRAVAASFPPRQPSQYGGTYGNP